MGDLEVRREVDRQGFVEKCWVWNLDEVVQYWWQAAWRREALVCLASISGNIRQGLTAKAINITCSRLSSSKLISIDVESIWYSSSSCICFDNVERIEIVILWLLPWKSFVSHLVANIRPCQVHCTWSLCDTPNEYEKLTRKEKC